MTQRRYPLPTSIPQERSARLSRRLVGWPVCLLMILCTGTVWGAQNGQIRTDNLRLIPFPKQVQLLPDSLKLQGTPTITVVTGRAATQAALDLKQELTQIAQLDSLVSVLPPTDKQPEWLLCLSANNITADRVRSECSPIPEQAESYTLVVDSRFAAVGAKDEAGLVWGAQTLRQLVRANLRGNSIPGVRISDWPALSYRGWLNDITRGLSPKMNTFEQQIRMTALLKMNFFTWYMEYQFAFPKHPKIGPPDGSFTQDELRALVKFAKRYHVDIIGNQQSFGHFSHILAMDEYKHLAETSYLLNPTIEETYQFLDDLYSAQAPLTESKFFNVCCDEAYGLGKGPSKALVEKIGVGGVYAGHVKRLHDLVKNKYGKRMMMWADIITKHPDHLKEIPKDTIIIPWDYWIKPSYDEVIAPIADAGYEFFFCPAVICWYYILPDFDMTVGNIRGLTRDAVKHGASGMINSTWDDGENFDACNWHGITWGAECAWNASGTPIEDFNRRVGAVLFAEGGDHFGQAIKLLGKTHKMDGFSCNRSGWRGVLFDRFWDADFPQGATNEATARKRAEAFLAIVEPALEHLAETKSQAKVNAGLLDYFVFGSERMKLIATRMLDLLSAADSYRQAIAAGSRPEESLSLTKKAQGIIHRVRDQHAELKQRYAELWTREAKPYALDLVLGRFDKLIGRYDKILAGLQRAIEMLEAKRSLPPAGDVGLDFFSPAATQPRRK